MKLNKWKREGNEKKEIVWKMNEKGGGVGGGGKRGGGG